MSKPIDNNAAAIAAALKRHSIPIGSDEDSRPGVIVRLVDDVVTFEMVGYDDRVARDRAERGVIVVLHRLGFLARQKRDSALHIITTRNKAA
jgi:hypothetical protein